VGTDKRARQKANRLQRQQEQLRAARVGTIKRTVARWTIIAVVGLAGVVFIAWLGGAFDGDEPASETDVPPTIPSYETPDKPEVELPDELPTELVVTTLVEGDGATAAAGDTVVVHYVGVRSEDGTEFDNSYDRGSPFPVVLGAGGVIDGWDRGLVGARSGARLQLDIPADLAYGDTGAGELIRPGDALTFVIDVLDVIPAS
jgi:peptidylprolyl isomerase